VGRAEGAVPGSGGLHLFDPMASSISRARPGSRRRANGGLVRTGQNWLQRTPRLRDVARVVVLEDEPLLLEELEDFLEDRGHRVTAVGSVAAFREAWAPGKYDITVVDRGLPDGDGLDLVAELRATGGALWIIIMTGRGEIAERISGLDRGADHYLVKPVRLEVLAATVDALLRRNGGTPEPRRWILEEEGWRLVPPGRAAVPLNTRDFTILKSLIQVRGRPVLRLDLIASLGENPLEFDQRRLDKEMSRLRQKVHAETGLELPVQTVHGIGYVFTAEAAMKP